ncbi:MAG: hypothetical protein WC795_02690 [Candidatus Paceibacterota bacterium]|jgi:hypothetical protein
MRYIKTPPTRSNRDDFIIFSDDEEADIQECLERCFALYGDKKILSILDSDTTAFWDESMRKYYSGILYISVEFTISSADSANVRFYNDKSATVHFGSWKDGMIDEFIGQLISEEIISKDSAEPCFDVISSTVYYKGPWEDALCIAQRLIEEYFFNNKD